MRRKQLKRPTVWAGLVFCLFFVAPTILMAAGSAPVAFNDPNPQAQANFGYAIAQVGDLDGDGVPDLLVGAPGQNGDQGQAFVLSGATRAVLLTLNNPNPQPGAQFGFSVASAGDINGDGKNDLLVGAPGQNGGVGQAFVFSGKISDNGLLLRTLNLPDQTKAGAFFGSAVASGGGHLIVGAPGQNTGVYVGGEVLVFSSADPNLNPIVILDPDGEPNDTGVGFRFGSVVASFGADIVIGNGRKDVGLNVDQGRVYIYSGSSGSQLRTIEHPDPQEGAFFGASAAVVGDVDGDGIPDILIGAPRQDVVVANTTYENQGRAYLFSGDPTKGLIRTLDLPQPAPTSFGGSFANFGFALAGADITGDGIPDLLIGAPGLTLPGAGAPGQVVPNFGQGRAFVFDGADGHLLLTLDDPTPQQDANFGAAVASGGDIAINGSSYLFVGVPFQNVGINSSDQGQVFLFANHAPIANAGPDQKVRKNELVNLNGSASSDPDGDPLTFFWTQIGGPPVVLSDPASPTPTFRAPSSDAVLVFALAVSDGIATSSDTVTITVGSGQGGGAGVDLTGTITRLEHKVPKDGDDEKEGLEELHFTLQVVNIGTQESMGSFMVKFYLSPDTALDNSDMLIFVKDVKGGEGKIKPGKKISVSGNVKIPGPLSGKFLIAFIDSENAIPESNETNNIVTRQIP